MLVTKTHPCQRLFQKAAVRSYEKFTWPCDDDGLRYSSPDFNWLERQGRIYILKIELARIEEELTRADHSIKRPQLVESLRFETARIWKMQTQKGQQIYLCSKPCNNHRTIIVSGLKYHKFWIETEVHHLRNKQRRRSFALPLADMPLDRKFNCATRGFQHGYENPVPTPDVSVWNVFGYDQLNYTNGITRSHWLLFNKVDAFPVTADNKSADFLEERAGI